MKASCISVICFIVSVCLFASDAVALRESIAEQLKKYIAFIDASYTVHVYDNQGNDISYEVVYRKGNENRFMRVQYLDSDYFTELSLLNGVLKYMSYHPTTDESYIHKLVDDDDRWEKWAGAYITPEMIFYFDRLNFSGGLVEFLVSSESFLTREDDSDILIYQRRRRSDDIIFDRVLFYLEDENIISRIDHVAYYKFDEITGESPMSNNEIIYYPYSTVFLDNYKTHHDESFPMNIQLVRYELTDEASSYLDAFLDQEKTKYLSHLIEVCRNDLFFESHTTTISFEHLYASQESFLSDDMFELNPIGNTMLYDSSRNIYAYPDERKSRIHPISIVVMVLILTFALALMIFWRRYGAKSIRANRII